MEKSMTGIQTSKMVCVLTGSHISSELTYFLSFCNFPDVLVGDLSFISMITVPFHTKPGLK